MAVPISNMGSAVNKTDTIKTPWYLKSFGYDPASTFMNFSDTSKHVC